MGHSIESLRVEVDLDAIVANARDVQALVGPSKGVLAVLKADAYGHGLVPVARALERERVVAGFVVTSLASGLSLRREGIDLPVIALLGQYGHGHGAVLEAGLTPVLTSIADAESFARAARTLGRAVAAHVEIDTGMSRLGVREDGIALFLAALSAHPRSRSLDSARSSPPPTATHLLALTVSSTRSSRRGTSSCPRGTGRRWFTRPTLPPPFACRARISATSAPGSRYLAATSPAASAYGRPCAW